MKIILAVAAAPLVVIAMVTTAWAVDDWRDGSSVARNVVLAGTPVGGMRSEELEATVRRLAEELPATEVRIEVGDEVLRSTAGALGIGVDVEATVRRVERIGTSDPLPTRPVRWLRSLFSPRRAEVALSVDAERVASTLRALEGDRRQEPVEPTLRAGETVEAVEGTPGREITVHDVVQAIPRSLDDLSEPIVIPADQVLVAIGQQLEPQQLFDQTTVETRSDGFIIADAVTGQTSTKWVFAGGDAVSGPSSVVEAVAAGERAAVGIDKYLTGREHAFWRELHEVDTYFDPDAGPSSEPREHLPLIPVERRSNNFDEVEQPWREAVALRQAHRCLRCDYGRRANDKDEPAHIAAHQ